MRLFRSGRDPAGQLRAFREAAHGASVQTIDAAAVGGRMHLLLTLKQTVELQASSQLLAERAEVDFLLRVAGTEQISSAVRAAGSKPGGDSVVVIFGNEEEVRRGLAAISGLAKLRVFSRKAPGSKAAARVGPEERSSVVGRSELVARLLAERAALLKR